MRVNEASTIVQVESAPCRATAGPLTYVVAFANGGAKDVTQRYVSSFMTTEKLRCGAWWDTTLAPLRRLQLTGMSAPATCLWSTVQAQNLRSSLSSYQPHSYSQSPPES